MHHDGEAKVNEANTPSGSLMSENTEERGAILVLVLVFAVIGALFVLPILYYTSSVLRAGSVPTDKAEAVELAEGGTWVALSNQGDLFDQCNGGELISSLEFVTTTCEVISKSALRDESNVPYAIASVQVDEQVPAELDDGDSYTNPSTAADPAAWLADLATQPTAGKVWVPELPVRATSSGGTRDTTMAAGTAADGYVGCRVFFPGTFDAPIVIDGPTYFTSGVYYFTNSVTILNGADLVAGSGSELGCATDQTAIASAVDSPTPLNMSGFGGTFILGDAGRIVLDDSAGGAPIRFAINQRYVSELETSVEASKSVSILSVNGDGTLPTDALVIPGVLHVPASTIGVDGSPLAALAGYLPSIVTPGLTSPPSAPTNTNTLAFKRNDAGDGFGRVSVIWDAPFDNGAQITEYTAAAYLSSDPGTTYSCSPATSSNPDLAPQTNCIIAGFPLNDETPIITVTATNSQGISAASTVVTGEALRTDLNDMQQPKKPTDAQVNNHTDGINVTWAAPDETDRTPTNGYLVTVTDSAGNVEACRARFDEHNCVVASFALIPSGLYDIDIYTVVHEGPNAAIEILSGGKEIDGHVYLPQGATSPTPVREVTPFKPDVLPILDLSTVGTEPVDIIVAGYIAVPQGRILIGAASPSTSSVSLNGGVLASQISLSSGGFPDLLEVSFDNPIAQKRIRLVSTTDTRFKAESVAIVQVNESGSLAINSWVVQ